MNKTIKTILKYRDVIAGLVIMKLIQDGIVSIADIRHITMDLWVELWNKFIKQTDSHIVKMDRAMRPILYGMVVDVMNNIKRNPPPAPKKDINIKADLTSEQLRFVNLWMYDKAKWRKEFVKTGTPHIANGIVDGGRDALKVLNIDPDTFVTDKAIIAHTKVKSLAMAKGVTDSVAGLIKTQLGESLKAGESVVQMTKRMTTFASDMPKWKAKQISQTEMVSALNHGAMEGNKQSGVVWGTQWLAALDSRTRDTHRHMTENREAVKLEHTFSNGLQYPGDSGGSPAESINCRCTTKPLTEAPK